MKYAFAAAAVTVWICCPPLKSAVIGGWIAYKMTRGESVKVVKKGSAAYKRIFTA